MPTFRTYVLRIVEPDPREETRASDIDRARRDAERSIPRRILHARDVIDEGLPAGWSCEIEEWDS